jgi:RHS repeat-associated protein
MGQRVRKSGSHLSTGHRFYAYDEAGRVLGEYDGSGTALEEYVYLDGFRPVALVRGLSNPTPDLYPILTDHLGTPRKVLDGAGVPQWSWDAKDPYGYQMPDQLLGGSTFVFDLRFPGQRYDSETGLYHNGFRDYSPALGRYIQPDPIGLAGGWSPYGYVGANPVNGFDYLGLSEEDVAKITSRANKFFEILNSSGLRHQNPSINNSIWNRQVSPMHDLKSVFATSPGYLDCAGQSSYLEKNMNRWFMSTANGLDAKWRAWSDQATIFGMGHNWSVLTSSDEKDPIIWIDSLHGNISLGAPYSTCHFLWETGENANKIIRGSKP